MVVVDTNVLIDVLDADPEWSSWSSQALFEARRRGPRLTNIVVYAEFAAGFEEDGQIAAEFARFDLTMTEMTAPVALRAALAFRLYRRLGGARTNVLADFFIGAHASVLGTPLLTRDARRYRTYFPELRLITPEVK